MIAERTIDTIKRTLNREDITLDSTFDELGIDSFDALDLLFEVEEEFGVEIPDHAAKSIVSVREVVDGVERLLAGETIEPPAEAPAETPAETPEAATGEAPEQVPEEPTAETRAEPPAGPRLAPGPRRVMPEPLQDRDAAEAS